LGAILKIGRIDENRNRGSVRGSEIFTLHVASGPSWSVAKVSRKSGVPICSSRGARLAKSAGLMLVLITSALWGDPTGTPRLVCPESQYDFGERDENDHVVHEFTIRNEGTAPLLITSVRSSCGCTIASLTTNDVPPGGQTVLRAVFTLAGRRGRQTKTIMLETNDPLCERLQLTLTGTVISELALEPSYVAFGTIASDASVSRDVKLVSRRPGTRITGAVCDSISFTVEPKDPAIGWRDELTIRTCPPLALGQHTATVTLSTDHPHRPSIKLPLFAMVVGRVRTIPKELVVRGVPGASVDCTIFVYPGTVREYQILNVEPPVQGVGISVANPAPGTYRIDMTGVPVTSTLAGTAIKITTDLPEEKELLVPIRIELE